MSRPIYNTHNVVALQTTGEPVNVTIGEGDNRVAYFCLYHRTVGVTASIAASSGEVVQIASYAAANRITTAYRVINPPTGAFSITPTLNGSREHVSMLIVLHNVDQITPNEVVISGSGFDFTTNVTDDQSLLAFATKEQLTGGPTAPSFTPTGTPIQTEYIDAQAIRYYAAASITEATGTDVTASWINDGGAGGGAHVGIVVNGLVGPTSIGHPMVLGPLFGSEMIVGSFGPNIVIRGI